MKVAIMSTSRADLGIYSPLIRELAKDKSFEVSLFLGGSHQEPKSIKEEVLKTEGLRIVELKRTLFETNSTFEVGRAMARSQDALLEKLQKEAHLPDCFFVLGDRFEMFASASLLAALRIPLLHLYGGEVSYGAIDDKFRHAITQLAEIHFTSCERYRKRVIQMGHHPDSVINVGSLGVDGITKEKKFSKEELTERIGLDFSKALCLFTYHPETFGQITPEKDISEIISALTVFDFQVLITGVNQDPQNSIIRKHLLDFAGRFPSRVKFVESLGRATYFSACQYASLMIGNSSSGIIEAASFNLPVVNIGKRQDGREQSDNTVNSPAVKTLLVEKIKEALSLRGRQFKNIYQQEQTAKRICLLLKTEIPTRFKAERKFHEVLV